MLLEQPAPPITVQKITEGGGAEIQRWPRQQPFLQLEFRKGFLATGRVQGRLHQTQAPITGAIARQITQPLRAYGHVAELRNFNWQTHGSIADLQTVTKTVHGQVAAHRLVNIQIRGKTRKHIRGRINIAARKKQDHEAS